MRNPAPTPRELEVFAAVCRYGCDKDAGEALGITDSTVGKHCRSLYLKIGATNRLEAAMLLGWLVIPHTTWVDDTSGPSTRVAAGG
jgi:DNA-binding NarL/FixJ family response regulator